MEKKIKGTQNKCGKNTTDVGAEESLQIYGEIFYFRSESYLILKLWKAENVLYICTCNYFM